MLWLPNVSSRVNPVVAAGIFEVTDPCTQDLTTHGLASPFSQLRERLRLSAQRFRLQVANQSSDNGTSSIQSFLTVKSSMFGA
jgi:hypothetical protein